MSADVRYVSTERNPRGSAPEGKTAIPHELTNDRRLSLGALGIMCEFLTFPPGWSASAEELTAKGTESLTEVRGMLTELAWYGYVTRVGMAERNAIRATRRAIARACRS